MIEDFVRGMYVLKGGKILTADTGIEILKEATNLLEGSDIYRTSFSAPLQTLVHIFIYE